MSRREIIDCDVCATEKKEANHWWTVRIVAPIQNAPGGSLQYEPYLTVAKLEKGGPYPSKEKADACGEKCVCVLVQRFLATGSLDTLKVT